ncbi:hypothetical protein [Neobacillus mesonae]|uniref:hypothetical protein n=1 Tax=Neobacillus mesonae TaxID=1193713 RepID=UPI0020417D33|nr:hypothetical protein [Neobacillus mesonae]MCM3569920.1 hypothetical protein [Neobacillus mesonae]
MKENQFVLYDHHKQIRLQAERIAFFTQGEIIEAISENSEMYYLFFYKSRFLTAKKAKRISLDSYIEHAFKKGIVFKSPHPLIHALLSSNNPCQIISFQSLLQKLDRLYTPQEKAFILTFFESVIPKKQLFEEMKSIYYGYRRNGQMFLGYRIIRILMDFAPKQSLVKQLAKDHMFNKFAVLYNEKAEKLFAKDLIFAEKTLFSQKDNDQCFHQLSAILEKESRWIDLIALNIDKLNATPSADCFSSLLKQLEQHLNENEIEYILEELSCQLPSFLPIQQELFENYLKSGNIYGVFKMIHDYDFKLSNSQVRIIEDMLEHLDIETHSLQPETLQTLLKLVVHLFPEKAEKLLTKYVILLLKTHELAYIKEWLKPLTESHENLEIYKKIESMLQISEDLDQMQTLGKMYYEFKQLDKAIECFSWKMELEPDDPNPIQWLSKIYREMGMIQESNAYRELCIHLQKRA